MHNSLSCSFLPRKGEFSRTMSQRVDKFVRSLQNISDDKKETLRHKENELRRYNQSYWKTKGKLKTNNSET